MNYPPVLTGLAVALATSSTPGAAQSAGSAAAGADLGAMSVTTPAQRNTAHGPARNFTGRVLVDLLITAVAPSRVSASEVTFAPGARSNWHTHPAGQTLVITSGVGWVQDEGGHKREVRAGDVVWTAPGGKHWHGATPTNSVKHTAIQEAVDGENVVRLEPVTDAQYAD